MSDDLQPMIARMPVRAWRYTGGDPAEVLPAALWERIVPRSPVIFRPAGSPIHENPDVLATVRTVIPNFVNTFAVDNFYWFDPGRIYVYAGDWLAVTEDGELIVVQPGFIEPPPPQEDAP